MAISRIATREPEEDLRIRDGCGGTALTNTWDADSNRVGITANGTAYTFVYDTTAGIPAVIAESSGTTTVCYIREPGGELIARVHPSQGIRYYHFDELGSTRLLTDTNGTVTDRYAYDAYGSLLSHDRYSGSVNQPYQYVGQLGYYTHYQEPDFGLMQLGVRFYDAQVGRFGQRDQIREVPNPFSYVASDPLTYVDPTGLERQDVGPLINKCFDACECAAKWYRYARREFLSPNSRYGPRRDKMAHCFVSCKLVKDCGFTIKEAGTAGLAKECYDEFTDGGDVKGDWEADKKGLAIAQRPGSQCQRDCVMAYVMDPGRVASR